MKKILAILLAMALMLALCIPAMAEVEDSDFYGPIYDEWSEMTDEELEEEKQRLLELLKKAQKD